MKNKLIPSKFLVLYSTILLFNLFPTNAQFNGWTGDTSAFTVTNNKIESQFDVNRTEAWIAKQTSFTGDCTWEIQTTFDFNSSSSNFSIVYISTNNASFSSFNGYYILIGGSNDEVSLFSKEGNHEQRLITGIEKRIDQKSIDVSIKLHRSSLGVWTLFTKLHDESEYLKEGEAQDINNMPFMWFGIYCKYTKTRANAFRFNILQAQGEEYVDKEPPVLQSIESINARTLKITFNERVSIDIATLEITSSNNTLDSLCTDSNTVYAYFKDALSETETTKLLLSKFNDLNGNTMQATPYSFQYVPFKIIRFEIIDSNSVFIECTKPIQEKNILTSVYSEERFPKSYTLLAQNNSIILSWPNTFEENTNLEFKVSNLHSIKGETLDISTFYRLFHPIETGDIVFNEVLADPDPTVKLPNIEFIEVYNNTNYNLPLYNIRLHVNASVTEIKQYVWIAPFDFAILYSTKNEGAYTFTDKALEINNFPSLLNESFETWLDLPTNKVIDYMNYTSALFSSPLKKNGGWSIEKMDPNSLTNEDNWQESESLLGGTPGAVNSIFQNNPDNTSPYLVSYFLYADSTITLHFSEPIKKGSLENTANYTLNSNHELIQSAIAVYPHSNSVVLYSRDSFIPEVPYHITITGLSDLNGNPLEETEIVAKLPEPPVFQDIVINEIMPDPEDNTPEYIELYNRSEKHINLNDLVLTKRDDEGNLKEGVALAKTPQLFAPQSFLVLCNNKKAMLQQYAIAPEHIIENSKVPSLTNETDNLVLLNRSAQIIDELKYETKWHYPFLNNTKGVSLERINPNVTNQPSNWTSASSFMHYATPGKENSQYKLFSEQQDDIKLVDEVLTPDNDGDRDQLIIQTSDLYAGYSIRVQILNTNGAIVAHPIQNEILGNAHQVYWDGFSDAKTRLNAGIYIAYIELINPSGQSKQAKLPFVISFK